MFGVNEQDLSVKNIGASLVAMLIFFGVFSSNVLGGVAREVEGGLREAVPQSSLDEINVRVDALEKSSDDENKNTRLYLQYVSIISSLVISLVGITLGSGAFYIYRENRKIKKEVRRKKEKWERLFKEVESDAKRGLEKIEVAAFEHMRLHMHKVQLQMLIERPSPNPNEVFSHLNELVRSGKGEFLPVIKKVASMNIDDEITGLAKERLSKI